MHPSWKHFFVLACIADISACSSTKAVEEYAIEHNLIGERVCNAQLPRASAEDAMETSCPAGSGSNAEMEESNAEEKENTKEESAL